MVLLDRNWRCEAGEIDLVLRDGDVLVVCEVKTRSSVATARRTRRSPTQGRPAAPAGDALAGGARARRAATSGSTWSRCCGRAAGASSVEHVRGIG